MYARTGIRSASGSASGGITTSAWADTRNSKGEKSAQMHSANSTVLTSKDRHEETNEYSSRNEQEERTHREG